MSEDSTESAEDTEYRARVRAWLAENAAEYAEPREFPDDELARRSKEWVRRKWEAGYSAIDSPKEMGGAGGTPRQARIFAEEERRYHVPQGLGPGSYLGMAGITRHGTPEQVRKWGTIINSGAGYWCQLFSEPAAGSDLAALRTKAERDGDRWIINGQKVWSSWAHVSDYGILIARTDPTVPKHNGLSFFVIDMRQPGITVRPIRQITGRSDFNETFLENAVVPDENRIGAEGEGWAVTMTVLAAERNMVGTASADAEGRAAKTTTANLIRAARNSMREHGSALDSAAVRAKIAEWHVQEQGIRNFLLRMQQQLAQGEGFPATAPITKLISANRGQQVQAFLMDMEEYAGLFEQPGQDEDKFYDYLWSSVMRIAGGADEVLRNQLAERALGMPGEVRADKGVPFNELPY